MRALLAAAPAAPDREALLAAAERQAAILASARLEHARALAELVRAAVSRQRGDEGRAHALLEAAAARFDEAGLPLMAAVSRRRRGVLSGGEEGRTLVEAADAAMRARAVRSPERLARMWAPGL